MIRKLGVISGAVLSSTLLLGCGGGSSGSSAGTVNSVVPLENGAGMELAVDSESVPGNPSDLGVTSMPEPEVETEPVIPPTVPQQNANASVQLYGPIANLFGSTRFIFGFSESDTAFSLDLQWGSESLFQFDDGDYGLSGRGDLFSIVDQTNVTITSAGERDIFCFLVGDVPLFACSVELADGGSVEMLMEEVEPTSQDVVFQLLGDMEFCDAETTIGDCSSELFNTPDGPAGAFVRPIDGVAAPPLQARNGVQDNLDVEYGLIYLDQGSASMLVNPSSADIGPNQKNFIRRIVELRNVN